MCFKFSKSKPLFLRCLLLLINVFLLQTPIYAQEVKSTSPSEPVDNVAELTTAFDSWMLRAYEGDRDAQFKVALMFSDGTGTEKDIEQAVYWYIQAARQGLASAQYNLGHKYLNGEGVRKDVNQAIHWWLKAAKQEHELAQFNVARAYYGGIGVEKNTEHAHYWFRKAAANNEPRSEKILVSIFQETPGSVPITPPADLVEVTSATPEASLSNVNTASINNPAQATSTNVLNANAPQVQADSSIAIYTRPDKNSMLVSIVPKNTNISVVKTEEKWLKISVANGLPVWVHRDFVESNGDLATITGNNVNARAVPLVLRGSVIGQFFEGTQLPVLETQEKWIRLQSTADFTAWIERSELAQSLIASTPSDQKNAVATSQPVVVEKPINVASAEKNIESVKTDAESVGGIENVANNNVAKDVVKSEAQYKETVTNSSEKYAFKNARNDNDWLFGLPNDSFTIQLASFSADNELDRFLTQNTLTNDPNVKQFISNRNDIEWKYLLYGNYADRSVAENIKADKKFKNSWIRKVSQIRKNRCLAWKTILPTPPELKTYCQK